MSEPMILKSKITSRHQITIPLAYYYLFENASEVAFVKDNERLIIYPVLDEDELYNSGVSGHPVIGAGKKLLSADYDLECGTGEIAKLFGEDF